MPACWSYWNTATAGTTNAAWGSWTGTGNETAVTTANQVWQIWTTAGNVTTATTTNHIWLRWFDADGREVPAPQVVNAPRDGVHNGGYHYHWDSRTKEEREKQDKLLKEAERKRKVEERRKAIERRKARDRARLLLALVLTEEEHRQYRRHRSVRVTGSLGGHYEVGAGPHGSMVCALDADWKPTHMVCYQPGSQYVVEDRVLALVLDIKCDESRIRGQGNRRPIDQDSARRVEKRRLFQVLSRSEAA